MTRHALFPLLISLVLPCCNASGAESEDVCTPTAATTVWTAPRQPKSGDVLRIMAVSTAGTVDGLAVFDHEGNRIALTTTMRGGPPWSLSATTPPLKAGGYRLEAQQRSGAVTCEAVEVGGTTRNQATAPRHWSLAMEAFYSAWAERLFDASVDENFAFPSLQPVLRNREWNFLHDYLGLQEDKSLPATPDCADLPYFLRSYFAWKMGLPIAYRQCSRGSASSPPRCDPATIRNDFTGGSLSATDFRGFSRQLVDAVHSGSARTALKDDGTDYYPLALNRESLWPGTVYADPYGHVLVLVKWVPQKAGSPGRLLAVDAQPDHSVTRKRFWEGTFLFANPIASAGPGFKAFRPLLPIRGNTWQPAANQQLIAPADALPISLEQLELDPDAFYARMDALINPHGLDPRQAYEAMLDALVEQLETRVTALDNAEAYFRNHPGAATIAMPKGAAIFETVGPWEDYSTPSRDMRLLIAMNVLMDLPERLKRYPELYALDGRSPASVADDLETYHAARVGERRIIYTRSDGSRQPLTVAEILARKSALEMAYNPNDCVEARWGASRGSAEYAPCKRQAPASQRALMEQYRPWFRDAKRPPR